jgi:hypothetical protein
VWQLLVTGRAELNGLHKPMPHIQTAKLAKALMLIGLIMFCASLIVALDGYDFRSMLLSFVGVGLALCGYFMQSWGNA